MKTSILILLAFLSTMLRAELRYTIVQLEQGPNAPSTYASYAASLNNRGTVVGSFISADFTTQRLFLFDRDTGMKDLGDAGSGGLVAYAQGLNDSGMIAGWASYVEKYYLEAFGYRPDGGFEFLGTLGGDRSEAYAINSRGQVTGLSTRADSSEAAFRYTEGRGMEDLGVGYIGYGINDLGWVTGADAGGGAFLFRDDVGAVLIGPGRGTSVNNRGVVALDYGYPWGNSAAVWQDGQTRFLGTLGGNYSVPGGINDKNQVVGSSGRSDLSGAGFIWNEQEGMLDLNALVPEDSGWHLGDAVAINENGWIAGCGYYQGKSQGYLLIPIPPTLQIRSTNTNVSISWAPAWLNLVLEAAPAADTNHWQAVPGGTTSPVLVPATSAGQVFRLSQYDSLDPVLSLTVAGTNVIVSWSPPWPDYVLEASPALTPPTWAPVPGGTNSPVSLPASAPGGFFRLRK